MYRRAFKVWQVSIHPFRRSYCALKHSLSGDFFFFFLKSRWIKRLACVSEALLVLLANTRLSQPWRSCGSSKFLMKNNLIERLLLPSASGRHRGHTQQTVKPVDSFTKEMFMSVLREMIDDTELSSSATVQNIQFSDHCWAFLEPTDMNKHLCDVVLSTCCIFCMENMRIFPDAKVGKGLRISKPLPDLSVSEPVRRAGFREKWSTQSKWSLAFG